MAQFIPVDHDPFEQDTRPVAGISVAGNSRFLPVDHDPFLMTGPDGDAVAEHRNWSDIPAQALSNVGSSALQTAKNIAYPVMHPIKTYEGLKSIGSGAISKAEGALGMTQDPAEKAATEAPINAVGKFFKDRYGGTEQIKQTLATDPVGALADAAAVLTGGGALAAKVPGTIGKAGQIAGKVGSAIDPIANTARVVSTTGDAIGNTAAAVLGTTTGAGSLPVKTAFQAGREVNPAFLDNMRGQAPITDTLDMAKSAMGELRQDRSDAYKVGMANVNRPGVAIDFTPVERAVWKATGEAHYMGVAKSKDVADVLAAMSNKVEEFTKLGSNEPAALDALKQAIGEIRQKTPYGTMERRVADNVYQAAKKEIVKQVPEYAKTMKDYSQASDQIDELLKTFSLGDKASKDTALRKLTSVMRNNVNTNYGQRTQLMNALATKQPDLPYAIAGQALNSLTPRGLQSVMATGAGAYGALTNPLALAGLPMASPRVVGEAAYHAGRAYGKANALSKHGNRRGLLPVYAAGQGMNALSGGQQNTR